MNTTIADVDVSRFEELTVTLVAKCDSRRDVLTDIRGFFSRLELFMGRHDYEDVPITFGRTLSRYYYNCTVNKLTWGRAVIPSFWLSSDAELRELLPPRNMKYRTRITLGDSTRIIQSIDLASM